MLLRALRQAGSEATLGWGVTISGARRLRGPFDGVARFQMSGGEGIARYVGELGPRFDGASRGDARPLRVLAGSAHYEHGWTPRWRWAIGASGVDVEGATSAHPAPRRTRAVFANTVFETAEGLDLAAEVVWGEQQAASGRRPRGGLYRLTGRLAF
jgi:hypothetical protein